MVCINHINDISVGSTESTIFRNGHKNALRACFIINIKAEAGSH